MLSNSQISKISRKQKRCSAIVSKETGIEVSSTPTLFLGICNAGLSTGLQEEILLQEALKYGKVEEIVMIPNKSYCFMKTSSIEDAVAVYNGMHGISKIGQSDGIVYLAYFNSIPKVESLFGKLPSGLIILEDFVSSQEEEILLKSIFSRNNENDGSHDDNEDMSLLKHRIVKHFGYEFLYGTNQVDPEKPLNRKIPTECDFLWVRLKEKIPNMEWYEPDQLTVNQYKPGQGIPPHVDTHSAFLDPLLVVSLEGDVVMEFKQQSKRTNVLIPQRSLLIMSGESRYDWTHGITPRCMDVVPSEGGGLTVKHRLNRTSLTFRKLRRGPCTCAFPRLCDSRQVPQEENSKLDDVLQELENCAQQLETENVHKVYDEIANHFSKTRHTPWPKVTEFINSFEEGSVVLDIGCGNGKYLGVHPSVMKIGCDRSEKLLKVCCERNFNVFRCDCLNVPFRDDCVDGCISIAVIHHLATQERRLQAIKEMIRILRSNGRALIYVWAKNQEVNCKKSTYLRQGDKEKRENLKNHQQQQEIATEKLQETLIQLPVHVNRTRFEKQDVFVPWKLKDGSKGGSIKKDSDDNKINGNNGNGSNETFLRYYHVFEENELENLCKKIENIEIVNSYYDEGNWCIVLRKL